MLSRRVFLAAWAPPSASAFRGTPLAASYDLHTRTTTLVFDSPTGPMASEYQHDTSLVSRPQSSVRPVIHPAQPKFTLRSEGGAVVVYGPRGRDRALMLVPPGAAFVVVYPTPAHPDLTAWFSLDGRQFYTNNDYRNVYELPEIMNSDWSRPKLRRVKAEKNLR